MSAMELPDYIDDADPVEEVPVLDVLHLELPLQLRGERLDKAIAKILPEYSRSKIQTWLDAGHITHNDKVLHAKDSVTGAQTIQIVIPHDPQNDAYQAQDIPLEVIYSDKDLALIYKPFGMVVHPAAGNWSGTMLNAVLFHFPECSELPRAGIVHRLDKDTSGLLVIAKSLIAQTGLVHQLQNHSMQRKYLALAWGKTPANKVLHGAIGRDPRDRLKMAVQMNGKEATTHLRTLAHISFEGRDLSLVSCVLETGRTHQIRVHLESIGHALFNDPIYKNKIQHQVSGKLVSELHHDGIEFPGQFLHAGLLGFVHPVTKVFIRHHVPPPEPFLKTLAFLGVDPLTLQKELQE
jgi:23S rRNA pseudouridine1911/1915/1917 synthase